MLQGLDSLRLIPIQLLLLPVQRLLCERSRGVQFHLLRGNLLLSLIQLGLALRPHLLLPVLQLLTPQRFYLDAGRNAFQRQICLPAFLPQLLHLRGHSLGQLLQPLLARRAFPGYAFLHIDNSLLIHLLLLPELGRSADIALHLAQIQLEPEERIPAGRGEGRLQALVVQQPLLVYDLAYVLLPSRQMAVQPLVQGAGTARQQGVDFVDFRSMLRYFPVQLLHFGLKAGSQQGGAVLIFRPLAGNLQVHRLQLAFQQGRGALELLYGQRLRMNLLPARLEVLQVDIVAVQLTLAMLQRIILLRKQLPLLLMLLPQACQRRFRLFGDRLPGVQVLLLCRGPALICQILVLPEFAAQPLLQGQVLGIQVIMFPRKDFLFPLQ